VITKQVRRTIDQPRKVQNKHVSQCPSNKERRPETLPPKLDSNLGRENKAHVKSEPWIELLLEHDHRILVQIAKIQFLPSPNHLGVFLDVQPTHVCEEEPSRGVVWVGMRLGILVVDAMVAGPVVDGSLVRDGVAQHEEEADGKGGGVGTVRPEAMDSDGYAKATNWPQNESPHQRLLTAVKNLRRTHETNYMDGGNVNAHGPIDRTRVPVMLDHGGNFGDHFEGTVHG
jgi:hypothetical protein